MRHTKSAIAVLFLLTLAHAAFGQTGGVITGVISDPAGAVVPNAPIEAKNSETGVTVSAATSATRQLRPRRSSGRHVCNKRDRSRFQTVRPDGDSGPATANHTRRRHTRNRHLQRVRDGNRRCAAPENRVGRCKPQCHYLPARRSSNGPDRRGSRFDAGGTYHSRRKRRPHFDQHQWHAGRQRTDPDRRSGRNIHFGECLLLVWSAQRGFHSGGRGTNQ